MSSPNSPANQPAWHTDPWNPDQLRYFDGREWTTTVTPRPETPAEHDLGQPGSTEGQGFPLGQCILHVRALPQRADIDVACSIENAHRQQIAQIRPISNRHYVLLSQHEMALGFFTRGSGSGVRGNIDVSDASHRPVGRLCRTNNYWQRIRSSAIDITLDTGQQIVGQTRVSVSPRARFAPINEPIVDTSGGVVATVQRQWRYVDTSVTFYDYTLQCSRPTNHPQLLLATVFA
ncbi:DUF2510 domain-containing protein, partial [Mycolicibacterium alvei]|uniref:DUF2510 domain-containing protein n=1 Tax=Mycolicibacterium alvei TaxID=67081 RepID=UPI003CD084DB